MDVAARQCPSDVQFFFVQKEAVAGKGEDAYLTAACGDFTLLGVFDGCGGLGSRKYPDFGNHTAAYIASRIVAASVETWLEAHEEGFPVGSWKPDGAIASDLKAGIDAELYSVREKLDKNAPALIGSLVRSFPTTAAMALIERESKKKWNCWFLWAGDSRGYLLTPAGLYQCTKDDLRSEGDAFENLYEDSSLSNVISADGDYVLHAAALECTGPAVVLTATDGMFAYLPSPMHFEWLLLHTLCCAENEADWKQRLYDEIAEVTGDDSTLAAAVVGWKSFEEMKAQFQPRYLELSAWLEGIESQEALKELWMKYKPAYERLQRGGC